MSMVERVALAIHEARGGRETHWFHERADKCILSRELARAAIEAMREPTEAMKDAGRNPPRDLVLRDSRSADERARAADVFKAMIDAALHTEGDEKP